jgi:hypothetical protein
MAMRISPEKRRLLERRLSVRLWCYVLIGLSLCLFRAPDASAAQPVVTVRVNTARLGVLIPKDFLGISNEVSTSGMGLPKPTEMALGTVKLPAAVPAGALLVYALGEPGAPNAGFFNFMRNLGPGVLRFGGNSQDNTCWDLKAAPHSEWCQGPITADLLKLYSTAVSAAGWKMIVGLNLKQNSPSWAAGEIADGVSKQIPASQIIGLELGNEPDLFSRTPARPNTYAPQDYVKDALDYIRALRGRPVARKYDFVAPALCCGWRNPADLDTILKGIGPDLKVVSIHNYTTSTCGHKNVTAAELLSPELMERFNALSRKLVEIAHQHGLPVALAETNSASCGGMAGVSNAFASAVWGLDYMFNVARDGYVNIDFHFSYRSGGSAYNPVQVFGWEGRDQKAHYRNVAQPLYYAMYAFAENASGERFLPASIKTSSNISAFATTKCRGCEVHVFVINKDESAAGKVVVHLSGGDRASLVLLRATSLASTADEVHYGGEQFDTHGHISRPHSMSVVRDASGGYSFPLPNAAAAVLTVPLEQANPQ